jgi:hypothetical protein
MFNFLLLILKNIVVKLATTGAFSFLEPWLLKVDKWCEDKLGIDIIKQEVKFWEKYPGIYKRILKLEKESHAKCGIESFDGYGEIDERIKRLEKK